MRETSDGRSRTPAAVARRASSGLAVSLFRIVGFGIDKRLPASPGRRRSRGTSMEAFRRSNPAMCPSSPRFNPAFTSWIFALSIIRGALTTVGILVPRSMQFGKKFNADDLLSAVFGMRYLDVSNPSQGKNPGFESRYRYQLASPVWLALTALRIRRIAPAV